MIKGEHHALELHEQAVDMLKLWGEMHIHIPIRHRGTRVYQSKITEGTTMGMKSIQGSPSQ